MGRNRDDVDAKASSSGDEEEDLEDEDVQAAAAPEVKADEGVVDKRFYYTRIGRHFLRDVVKGDDGGDEGTPAGRSRKKKPDLTAADFNEDTKLMVTGFDEGTFLIHEMPEATLIHSLRISDQSIVSVKINGPGDWIAFGCRHQGQLLVWEWQSETFVLKQQGHVNNLACVAYHPDGATVATGGDDGKLKLWSATSGFCYVTFSEHTSAITGL